MIFQLGIMSNTVHSSRKELYIFIALIIIIVLIHSSRAFGQNVGIGTVTPVARLHVLDSSVLFSGVGLVSLPANNPPISGAGRRMMWYANKAAFRAGYVTSTNWDNNAVGPYSFGAGFDTRATGSTSVALGNTTTASANYSTAMGVNTVASGEYSTAMGYYSIASGGYSTALGFSNAKGLVSTSMGEGSVAKGYASTVIGLYNDSIITADQSSISTTTPLFIIGNGNSSNNRSNALVALKNGNIGIGTSAPSSPLHIRQGSAGGNTPYGPLSIESGTAAYIGLLTPDSHESGLIFGKNENNVSGGIVYNNLNTFNGFQFRTNGNATRMVIDFVGRVGIGTETPNAPLQLAPTTSNRKFVLYEEANNDHQFYGFGVNNLTLRYQTPAATDDHVFYSGINVSSSRELMRIKGNGNVGIGIDDPVYKLDLAGRMRIRSEGVFNTAGLYLNNNSNSQSPAFIGMEDDTHVGFYGSGSAWKLTMNTNTGALKINGSEGQSGQVLKSGGSSAPLWTTLGSLIKTAYAIGPSTKTVVMNTNTWTELPLSSELTITVDVKSRLIISGNFSLYGPECSPCANGYGKFAIIVGNFFIHNSNPDGFATVFMEANGEGAYTLANIMYDVQPGTYNIEFLAIRNPSGNNYSMRSEFVSVIAVPID